MYITTLVTASTTIAPKELEIKLEILEDEVIGNDRVFTVTVYIDEILNRTAANFNEDLLYSLNLIQENFGDAGIYESNLTREEYLRTLLVDWDIFPPGTREDDIQRVLLRRPNANREFIRALNDRYDVLMALGPQNIVSGNSGMRNYFGVKYSDTLVVFENLQYGNAIYILFENWEELSRLSRTQLLARPEDQFFRIKHKFGWQTALANVVNGRRNR